MEFVITYFFFGKSRLLYVAQEVDKVLHNTILKAICIIHLYSNTKVKRFKIYNGVFALLFDLCSLNN